MKSKALFDDDPIVEKPTKTTPKKAKKSVEEKEKVVSKSAVKKEKVVQKSVETPEKKGQKCVKPAEKNTRKCVEKKNKEVKNESCNSSADSSTGKRRRSGSTDGKSDKTGCLKSGRNKNTASESADIKPKSKKDTKTVGDAEPKVKSSRTKTSKISDDEPDKAGKTGKQNKSAGKSVDVTVKPDKQNRKKTNKRKELEEEEDSVPFVQLSCCKPGWAYIDVTDLKWLQEHLGPSYNIIKGKK